MAEPTDLNLFSTKFPHHCEYIETWPIEGIMQVRLGLASELPPESMRSSILAIITNDQSEVVFLYPDEDGWGISRFLIGGRPEGSESPTETVAREVREETGWQVAPARIIGYRYFHQTEARLERSDRPYPDFIQPIFAARAIYHDPSQIVAEDFSPWRMINRSTAFARLPDARQPLLAAVLLP